MSVLFYVQRMVYFTRQNLFLDVVCQRVGNTSCDKLGQEETDRVHLEAASMLSDVLRIENIGPFILCVLAGPFSDRYGRRLPLIASCVGMILTYIG